MLHDALLTKTKQRKIFRHLLDWFGRPNTAKERDVDALAGQAYVKRRYGDHSFLSRLGKKNLMTTRRKEGVTLQLDIGLAILCLLQRMSSSQDYEEGNQFQVFDSHYWTILLFP
jgi:hypothetical protein